jgi:antitoxin component of MazEF toxin-antitoxin module
MIQVKLRKIGNSLGVILPKEVITGKAGDVITIEVITDDVITKVLKQEPISKGNEIQVKQVKTIIEVIPTFCERKHKGRAINARSCGCY